MSNLELAETRLTFEDLLEAVQDSKRGRWFLQEYETRIQKRDTNSILSAISKLESRMEVLGPQASSPDDLAKVKNAISNARNDLFKLGLGKEAMSKEGRLFAELAEMARKAAPEVGEQNAGIVRTLQLVDEIDRTISPATTADAGAKFFVADANLFDRPAASKPVLVEASAAPAVEAVAAPVVEVAAAPVVDAEPPKPVVAETPKPVSAKKEEPVATGAKLIIRKVSAAAPVEADVVPPVVAEETKPAPVVAAPEAMPTSEMPKSSIQATENPRIVIIRRRAEDMPEASVSGASAA